MVGIIATLGIVLAALYVLLLYQRTMTGPVKAEQSRACRDLRAARPGVVALADRSLLFLGVYPKPVLDIINPAVNTPCSDVARRTRSRPTP